MGHILNVYIIIFFTILTFYNYKTLHIKDFNSKRSKNIYNFLNTKFTLWFFFFLLGIGYVLCNYENRGYKTDRLCHWVQEERNEK